MRSTCLLIALVGVLALPRSAGAQSAVGGWVLWSVDGLDPTEALPNRTTLDFAYWAGGTDTLFPGEVVWETRLDGSALEVLAGGDYRERRIQVSATHLAADAYRRLSGRLHFGDEFLTEVAAPDTSRLLGRWKVEGDSVLFYQTRDQVSESLAASVAPIFPTLGADSLRARMGSIVEGVRDENWMRVQLRGVLTSRGQLHLRDEDGRLRVYRRR